MKEMTIEEKAKAYDVAAEEMGKLLDVLLENGVTRRYGILYDNFLRIFPQLKQSEDEWVNKEIIGFINESYRKKFISSIQYDLWLSWLKKKSEQKPAEYTLEQAAGIFLDALSNTPYNNKPITDAQVIVKELLKFLSDASFYNPNALNEQKQEWSDFDAKMLARAMRAVNYFITNDDHDEANQCFAWLKSLKDRHTWKPNDEQLEALKMARDRNDKIGFYLSQLYDELKKLM